MILYRFVLRVRDAAAAREAVTAFLGAEQATDVTWFPEPDHPHVVLVSFRAPVANIWDQVSWHLEFRALFPIAACHLWAQTMDESPAEYLTALRGDG